jgi:PucR C-terminal helix-turn-helix domain/GGDEF-like domain
MGHTEQMRTAPTPGEPDGPRLAARLEKVAAGAAADSGVSADLLGEFLAEAAAAIAHGKRLGGSRVKRYELQGAEAARRNVDLSALIDLYLSAAWRLWREVPHLGSVAGRSAAATLSAAGEGMLRTSDDVVAAVAAGYQRASITALMQAASSRREFIDDLLANHGTPGELAQRAEAFGLRLAGPHRVAVAVLPERRIDEANILLSRAAAACEAAQGKPAHLVTSKDGRLIVVIGAHGESSAGVLQSAMTRVCGDEPTLRAGIGRSWSGESGPMRSYLEAVDSLQVAERLELAESISRADDLLIFLSMFRNRVLIDDLVRSVLLPLDGMRGGAADYLETLRAHFDNHGVATATARALHLSVRGLTYRLQRIRAVLSHDLDDPQQRLTVELALVAARLMDWPQVPLTEMP